MRALHDMRAFHVQWTHTIRCVCTRDRGCVFKQAAIARPCFQRKKITYGNYKLETKSVSNVQLEIPLYLEDA
jgi:hypothetical protein